MFCGWLLAAMPETFAQGARGLSLLEQALTATGDDIASDEEVPGFAERCRINAAYLLFDCLIRGDVARDVASRGPSTDELRALICRLDPASAFAETVFLSDTATSSDRRQSR